MPTGTLNSFLITHFIFQFIHYELISLINLLRSYLIKGLAVPLVGIKYPTISTNLLKHLNRKKGE